MLDKYESLLLDTYIQNTQHCMERKLTRTARIHNLEHECAQSCYPCQPATMQGNPQKGGWGGICNCHSRQYKGSKSIACCWHHLPTAEMPKL
jgi:hypothetical protein